MEKGFLWIWTFLVLIGMGWNGPSSSYVIAEGTGLTALETVAKSNTDFAYAMYRVLTEGGGGDDQNLIFSPYSISAVMAMVKLGANGTTAIDIRNAMKYPESDETLIKGYKGLLEILKGPGNEDFTLETVNKIYAKIGFNIKQNFTSQLKEYFNATIDQLDFCKGVEAANEINGFVEKVTKDKIKDLVTPTDFDEFTRLVLVNAIYFKGPWKYTFDKKNTKNEHFHIKKGQSVKVNMMKMERRKFHYADLPELDARAVALPYKGDKLWMIILLPNKLHGIKDLEEKLSTSNFSLGEIPKRMEDDRIVNIKMPRFKLESTINLKGPLTQLGAGCIFTQADFSNIPVNNVSLVVSEALQKAFIEVNEEGSEAAAVTMVAMGAKLSGAAFRPPPPIEFYMDHPFISVIAYKLGSEHEILFMSKVSNPPPSKSSSSAYATYTVTGEELKAVQTVVKANSRVSEAMSRVLLQCHPGGYQNLIFSPLSISTVMAMLKLGANGGTGIDIRMGMEYPENNETLNEGYKHLLQMLKGSEEFTLFHTLNKIYAPTGYKINNNFTSKLKEHFNSTIDQLDFSNRVATANQINNFVQNDTKNKSRDITTPEQFNGGTSLVLLNAVNIKGPWKYQFDKEDTTEDDFYIERRKRVKVPMMQITGKFRYSDKPEFGAKAVVLPYKDDRYFMTILLPNEVNGLTRMEAKLLNSKHHLDILPRNMRHGLVKVKMPKFKLESTLDLEEPLTRVGLSSIFNQRVADFSKIPQNKGAHLHVSKALHKVVIEVDEEGGEAQATNETEISHEMNINQPFLFVIAFNHNTDPECEYVFDGYNHHCEYGILFIGKVSNPLETSSHTQLSPSPVSGTLIGSNDDSVGNSSNKGRNVKMILTVSFMISWILG